MMIWLGDGLYPVASNNDAPTRRDFDGLDVEIQSAFGSYFTGGLDYNAEKDIRFC